MSFSILLEESLAGEIVKSVGETPGPSTRFSSNFLSRGVLSNLPELKVAPGFNERPSPA